MRQDLPKGWTESSVRRAHFAGAMNGRRETYDDTSEEIAMNPFDEFGIQTPIRLRLVSSVSIST